jgi:hypothetical protein
VASTKRSGRQARTRENYVPSEKQRAEDARLKNEVERHFDLQKFRKAIKPLITPAEKPAGLKSARTKE